MPIKEQPPYLAIIFICFQVLDQDLIKSEQVSSAATSAALSLWFYLLPVFDYLKDPSIRAGDSWSGIRGLLSNSFTGYRRTAGKRKGG